MNRFSDDILSEAIKKSLSAGGDYADIFIEHTSPVLIQLEDNRIEKLTSGNESGFGMRVIYDGKSAYAYSNDFSGQTVINMAESLSRAVREKRDQQTITLEFTRARPSIDFVIRSRPGEVPVNEKVSLVENANSIARKVSPKIRQVSITYRDSVQQVCIASSDGIIAEDERIHTVAIVCVVASDGVVLQTGYEPVGGLSGFEIFNENPLGEIAERAAKKAVSMLSARKAPGGRMPVVISSNAGGTMIHEAIGHGLEADLVQQGLSVYTGKIGQEVASPLVSVIDDSTLPNKRGSFRFDDEGVSSQRTVLVERGVLKGFMHNRLTAMKEGIESTGNGRRQSYKYRPIPRMTNTFIDRGETPPEEIIKSIDRGIFVRKMGGGQVNTVTGEFVFKVSEGYLIEKGLIGEPVKDATLIGNGPDILKSIDMVGNDLGFSIGTCGKDSQGVPVSDAMPTLRIPEIVVGGEV